MLYGLWKIENTIPRQLLTIRLRIVKNLWLSKKHRKIAPKYRVAGSIYLFKGQSALTFSKQHNFRDFVGCFKLGGNGSLSLKRPSVLRIFG